MKEYFRYITDQQMHVNKIYFIDVHFFVRYVVQF